MANDRWVNPVGELLAPKTEPGNTGGSVSLTWANPDSLSQRAGTRVTAWGLVTSVASHHLGFNLNGLIDEPYNTGYEAVMPTAVTDQPWRLDYIEYCTDASDSAPKISYALKLVGLFATDLNLTGVATGTAILTVGNVSLYWGTAAADSTGADSVTLQGCIVESIG